MEVVPIMKLRSLVVAGAALSAIAIAPQAAFATAGATSTATGSVTGAVLADQISLTAAVDTPLSPLSHTAPAVASTALAVVSTNTAWDLTMADTSAQNKGKLKPCTLNGTTGSYDPVTDSTPLAGSLKFANTLPADPTVASNYTTLGSGTQTVKTGGSLVGAATVWWFEPALVDSDSIAATSTYCTKITYTVTSTA